MCYTATLLIKNTFVFGRVGQEVIDKFQEKAQFTLENLRQATPGCTDALIPLEKMVILLGHHKILAVLPPKCAARASVSCDVTYFMPCILKSATASEMKVPCCLDAAPLMLRYECGYVPLGMFCSMVTSLVSSQHLKGWELIEDGPRRNMMQFYVGDEFNTVTLMGHPTYLEVIISSRGPLPQSPTSSVCAHVRGVVASTLKMETSVLKYHPTTSFKFGFECPSHPGRDHLCVLAKEEASSVILCLKNPKKKTPLALTDPRHKVWFEVR